MPPPIIGVFRRGNLPAQALKAWLAQIDSEKSGEITSESAPNERRNSEASKPFLE